MTAGRIGFRLLVALLLPAMAVAGAGWWAHRWLDRPLPVAAPEIQVTIEPGSSARDVAELWVAAGVQAPAALLYLWFRASGDARRIRAGTYAIDRPTSPRRLLQKLVQGEEALESVRLIEGWTFRQWRAALAGAAHLRAETAQMSEPELMAAIGASGVAVEGRFFPDTYRYSRGSSDLSVLKAAYAQMQRKLAAAWQARAPDLPLKSADEALVLASIVEKETGRAEERGLIAAVFLNRLRIGMPLQTDPTVIYGLGSAFDGNLRKRDLQADTVYNTYTRRGLPPTPIAMPGEESLLAAVQPQATRALYFVSRGDGTSAFSESLAEHNRAVNQYQRRGQP
jgi:UPF0755 protein